MKKLMLLALAFSFGLSVSAQQGRPQMDPQQMVKAQLEFMTKEMSLTADEQTKVEVVLTASAQEMQQAMQSAGGDRQAMREKFQSIRQEQGKKISAIVGQQRWDAYQKKVQEQFPNMGGGGEGRP